MNATNPAPRHSTKIPFVPEGPSIQAVQAFCWAQWRRRFFGLAKRSKAPIAVEALTRIGMRYEIEDEICDPTTVEGCAVRTACSTTMVRDLFA